MYLALTRLFFRFSLQQQVLLFTLFAVLTVAGLFYFIGMRAINQSTREALQIRLELARTAALLLENEIEEMSRQLEHAAAVSGLDLEQPGAEEVSQFLEHAHFHLSHLTQQFVLLDRQGGVLLSQGENLVPPDGDLFVYNCVTTALSQRTVQTSPLHWIEGKPVVWVASPLQKEDRVTGAMLAVADLSQSPFFATVLSAFSDSPYSVEVVDNAGLVLASSQGENLFQSVDHRGILASLVRGKREVVRECHSCRFSGEQVERREEILAVASLKRAPWAVMLHQPEKEVLAAASALKRNFLLGGVAALGVIASLSVLGNGLMIRRLRRLSTAARGIAQGDLSTPVSSPGSDEIAALARDLEEMRLSLSQTRRELEQRIRKRSAELSALYQIDRLVMQTLPQEEFLEHVLIQAMEVLQADAGGIFLPENKGDLVLKVHQGVSPRFVAAVHHIRVAESMSEWAAELSRPLAVESSRYPWPTAQLARYAAEEGLRHIASAPLLLRGRPAGGIVLVRRQEQPFTREELELLEAVGSQLAISLERNRLLRKLEAQVEREAALARITRALSTSLELEEIYHILAAELQRTVEFDFISVRLLTAAEGVIERVFIFPIPAPEGLEPGNKCKLEDCASGAVMSSGEPLLRHDLEQERAYPLDEVLLRAGIRSTLVLPLSVKGKVLGTLNLGSSRVGAYSEAEARFLQPIAEELALAIDHARLYQEARQIAEDNLRLYQEEREFREKLQALAQELEKSGSELRRAYNTMAASLVDLLEARDPYTRGHSDRVRHYCRQMAHRLGLSPEEIAVLDQAAQLHDLGKISIPDSILRKPDIPSPPEWAELRLHPERTVELLRPFSFLQPALPIIHSHHERWDGRGYPDNLAREEIPLGARILAAADAYDAMTTERPYRRALSHAEAVEELKKGAGTQWQPEVVMALLQVLEKEQPPEYHR
jgi:HD-GYP domain-containing protein (c-di-GMP phosphodiesterase class II)/HAMP domain-containing protein